VRIYRLRNASKAPSWQPIVRNRANVDLIESGFDAERFERLAQDPEVKAQLLDNTQRSVARGTFGSPTFFVGDEIFFGKDRLRDVEELVLARR
jgi:2-hydroxychromene-2-carboxylate isomerase